MRVHPDVLELRWQIHSKEKRWLACLDIGQTISIADPNRASGWLNHSRALHHLKRTDEAFSAGSFLCIGSNDLLPELQCPTRLIKQHETD
jgi:hypothetical protein